MVGWRSTKWTSLIERSFRKVAASQSSNFRQDRFCRKKYLHRCELWRQRFWNYFSLTIPKMMQKRCWTFAWETSWDKNRSSDSAIEDHLPEAQYSWLFSWYVFLAKHCQFSNIEVNATNLRYKYHYSKHVIQLGRYTKYPTRKKWNATGLTN